MSSITRHKDRWRAHVFVSGQRQTKVFDTKREAQRWAIQAEVRMSSTSGGRSLATAVSHYLTTVSSTKREGAADWERRRFDTMLEHFGHHTPIGSITSDHVGRWRDKRLETVSGSTVQRESNLLRHLFSLACDEWRWVERNPFKGVRLPRENEARRALWGWRQIRLVLRAGQRSAGKTLEVTQAFHISLRTSMRLQEALAAPASFNPTRRVVTLKTKTQQRAEIPIGRIACKLLDRPPFTVGPNEASTLFSKLTKSLMISGLTFHDGRATALTHLAKKVDVMVLAKISQHKDISLLHRVYYRVTADEIARNI